MRIFVKTTKRKAAKFSIHNHVQNQIIMNHMEITINGKRNKGIQNIANNKMLNMIPMVSSNRIQDICLINGQI